jgi:hypothetical protein
MRRHSSRGTSHARFAACVFCGPPATIQQSDIMPRAGVRSR